VVQGIETRQRPLPGLTRRAGVTAPADQARGQGIEIKFVEPPEARMPRDKVPPRPARRGAV
jgi:hypothetical protein